MTDVSELMISPSVIIIQVFWYPLGPGSNENWAPVRVNALNEKFAELDGNADIEDNNMIVELHLVGLSPGS